MRYKLSELFDLQMGKTPSRNNSEYWNTTDNKWISIGDLSRCDKYITETKEYLSNKAVSESGISQIPANTVVMSFKLSIGKTAITTEPIYSNEAIMSFRDKGLVEIIPDYIYYLFTQKDWDNGSNKAVMGKTLNKATLSDVCIDIHPFEKQKLIVEILDKVSRIVSLYKQELDKLDEIIKARFVELFGDPRINPKGYEIKKISELFDVGSSKRVFESEWRDSGVPFYRAREIVKLSRDGFVDNELFIEEKMYECYKDKYGVPKAGDMMVTGVGTLGICYIVKDTDRFYFKDGNTLWFKNKGLCDVRFIKDQYDTDFVKEQINTNANVSTVGTYTITNAKETLIVVPPIEEQNTFTDFVAQIDKSKVVVERSLKKCKILKVWI